MLGATGPAVICAVVAVAACFPGLSCMGSACSLARAAAACSWRRAGRPCSCFKDNAWAALQEGGAEEQQAREGGSPTPMWHQQATKCKRPVQERAVASKAVYDKCLGVSMV